MLREWLGYFARGYIMKYLKTLMEWIRRRIRQYLWKQCKTEKNRRHKLRTLGISDNSLKSWKLGSNSYWKMAGVMNYFISNPIIHNTYGLLDAETYYAKLHSKRMEYDGIILNDKCYRLFA